MEHLVTSLNQDTIAHVHFHSLDSTVKFEMIAYINHVKTVESVPNKSIATHVNAYIHSVEQTVILEMIVLPTHVQMVVYVFKLKTDINATVYQHLQEQHALDA
jgi:hypothetical protein